MNEYVVLEDLKGALKTGTADVAADDLLAMYAGVASRIIDREASRVFYPRVETRLYDVPGGRKLMLDDDLMSVNSLTNGDDTSIASTEYMLHPASRTPKYALELYPGSTIAWQTDSSKAFDRQVIELDGVWCWHDEWSIAWDSVSQIADSGGITGTQVTIAIADWDGEDSYGQLAFSRGKLLRIEDEFLYVVSRGSADTGGAGNLTVIRGVNGSTAAVHAENTVIEIYRPPGVVKMAAMRLALWLYKQRSSSVDVDRPAVTADGVTVLPMALPKDVMSYISLVRRVIVT